MKKILIVDHLFQKLWNWGKNINQTSLSVHTTAYNLGIFSGYALNNFQKETTFTFREDHR